MRFPGGPPAALWLLLLVACIARALPVLEPGAAQATASGPQVDELLTRIHQAVGRGSGAGFVEISGIIAARDLHPAARDRLFRELALTLARIEPDPAARALIDELAHRSPGVRVWLHEGPHRIDVPLFDVAAAARYTSRRWAETAARRDALAALRAADYTIVERFAAGDDPFRKGVIAAVADLTTGELSAVRDSVMQALGRGADVGALALPIALRLGDAELAAALLLHGDPALLVHALPRIAATLNAADVLAVFEPALARAGIASAVLFEIGRLAARDGRAADLLLAALDDPDLGGSAAAALARLDDPGIARELGRRLEGGGSGLPERRALLALRLSETEAARDELERFRHSDSVSAVLQREMKTWSRP